MKKKLCIVFLFLANILNIHNVYAGDLNEDLYNINNGSLYNIGSMIAGYIVYIGILIAVVVLMIKGIKYITAAPEGKAEIKKELMPWFIGIVLLFSIRIILQFIADFAQNSINNLTI